MSATIHLLPGGERNPRLVMQQRLEKLATPAVQAAFKECQELLTQHQLAQLSVKGANSKR